MSDVSRPNVDPALEAERSHLRHLRCDEMERELLSAAISSAQRQRAVLELLVGMPAEDFGHEAHRVVVARVQRMVREGIPVDLTTVSLALNAEERQIVTPGFVASLADGLQLYNFDFVTHRAQEITRAAHRRRVRNEALRLADAYARGEDARAHESELTRLLAVAPRAGRPLRAYDDASILALPTPQWLLEPVLLQPSVVVIAGHPEAGKSLLLQSLCLNLPAGRNWMGMKTKPCRSVYVALEAAAGIKKRVEALKLAEGLDLDRAYGMTIVTEGGSLLEERFVDRLLQTIRGTGDVGLVVIDTWAKAIAPGDENKATDSELALKVVHRISEETGATMALLHHLGAVGERPRGSTALGGDVDTVIVVRRQNHQVVCEKQRDEDHFAPFRFGIRRIGDSVVPYRLEDSSAATAGSEAGAAKSSDDGVLERARQVVAENSTLSKSQQAKKVKGFRRERVLAALDVARSEATGDAE